MKEIRAYIQPFMLGKLTQKLLEIPDFPGMSVSVCQGFGHRLEIEEQNYSPFVEKIRIEIFASGEMVHVIFDAIMLIANTHQHGAGKVFILPVEESARISSGERGHDAL
jgi:nitrogen regulatory protein PII